MVMFRFLLTALLLGVGACCAGHLSRRARVHRRRERAAAERWEGEGGATL
jgi:hypothetical protein